MNKVVVDSSPVAVTQTSDLAPASKKKLLDIQGTNPCDVSMQVKLLFLEALIGFQLLVPNTKKTFFGVHISIVFTKLILY